VRISAKSGASLLDVATSNKSANQFPSSLKNWWDCTETSGRILTDVVSGMDYRADVPPYNNDTGEFDLPDNGGNLGTFSAIAPGAVRFTVDYSGQTGADGGALSNHRLGSGEQLAEAGTKPFIYMMHCKAAFTGARNHLGINNINLLQRLNIGTSLIQQPSISTGISGEDTDDTTNWTNIDSDWVVGQTALWAVVSDGTNSQLYKDGVAQASGVVNVHGNFSPTNAMGLSGIDEIRGFAWMIFDTLPADFEEAMVWMSPYWADNKKVFWPKWQ